MIKADSSRIDADEDEAPGGDDAAPARGDVAEHAQLPAAKNPPGVLEVSRDRPERHTGLRVADRQRSYVRVVALPSTPIAIGPGYTIVKIDLSERVSLRPPRSPPPSESRTPRAACAPREGCA